MTEFAACKPVADKSVTTYASVVMKIILRQNISHTLVLDKDSKFLDVFRQVVDLLQLNCHTLSDGHHDGQLVKHVHPS